MIDVALHEFRDDAVNSIWIRRGKTSAPWNGKGPGRDVVFTNAEYDAIVARVPGVEHATGRRVIGFMSGNQQEPDMICEIFVLAPNDIAKVKPSAPSTASRGERERHPHKRR